MIAASCENCDLFIDIKVDNGGLLRCLLAEDVFHYYVLICPNQVLSEFCGKLMHAVFDLLLRQIFIASIVHDTKKPGDAAWLMYNLKAIFKQKMQFLR